MLRSRMFVRVCLELLCVAILVTRVSGAHLHLCFDGSEPRASVQLTAVSSDDPQEGARQPRHDLDVSLIGDVLAKKLDSSPGLPMLLAPVVLLFILRGVGGLVVARDLAMPLMAVRNFRLRPPLRGPPR